MNFTSGLPFKNDTPPNLLPLKAYSFPRASRGWRGLEVTVAQSWEPFPKPLGESHPWLEPPRPCVSARPLPWDTHTEGLWFQSNAISLTRAFFSFFFCKMKANRMIHSLKSTHEKKGSHLSSQFSLL